mgnify:FL=1
MINCLICNKKEKIKFLDNYKLQFKEDENYFKKAKLYRCDDCDFSFVNPMPNLETLDYFYKNIYSSKTRPPYWAKEDYEDQKVHYLEDKNLSYLLYLTTLIDFKKIKNVFDFGCSNGDLGHALKIKFSQIDLFCSESDLHCKKILKERGYKNFENLNEIKQKFDLIIVTHALEHITDVNYIFKKFYDFLNPNGYIFFEVPNCPKEYWNGRPYDGLHLLYYTKKSMEKLADIHNLNFINFSFSAHSFENDRKYQIEDLKSVTQNNVPFFSLFKLKNFIKKILPKKITRDLKDYFKVKKTRDKSKLDWFVSNTGDNCYIRGVLKKKA